jgi:hypothetical protein
MISLRPTPSSATAACLAALSVAHVACLPRADLDAYSRGAGASAGPGVSSELPDASGDPATASGAPPIAVDASALGAGQEGPGPDIVLEPGTDSNDGSGCASDCQAPDGGDASAPVPADAGRDAAAPLPPGCAPDERIGPRGRCHIAVGALVSWQDARAACLARGAGWDLTTVRSRADSDFVDSIVTQETWLGGSDIATEETWVWANDQLSFWQGEAPGGGPLNGSFFNWFDDEPNGGEGSDCLRMLLDGRWADLECDEPRGYVCEGPPEDAVPGR